MKGKTQKEKIEKKIKDSSEITLRVTFDWDKGKDFKKFDHTIIGKVCYSLLESCRFRIMKKEVLTYLRENNYKIKGWFFYQSASLEGRHLEVYFIMPIKVSEHFKLREMFRDDPARLKISKKDFTRNFNYDMMFTHKKINGKWRERHLLSFGKE